MFSQGEVARIQHDPDFQVGGAHRPHGDRGRRSVSEETRSDGGGRVRGRNRVRFPGGPPVGPPSSLLRAAWRAATIATAITTSGGSGLPGRKPWSPRSRPTDHPPESVHGKKRMVEAAPRSVGPGRREAAHRGYAHARRSPSPVEMGRGVLLREDRLQGGDRQDQGSGQTEGVLDGPENGAGSRCARPDGPGEPLPEHALRWEDALLVIEAS